MRVFSHDILIHHPGYWRGSWYYHPYDEWRPVYIEIDEYAEEVKRIDGQTRVLLALKRRADAELLLLASETAVAQRRSELVQVQVLAPPSREPQRQIPYSPAVPMKVVR